MFTERGCPRKNKPKTLSAKEYSPQHSQIWEFLRQMMPRTISRHFGNINFIKG